MFALSVSIFEILADEMFVALTFKIYQVSNINMLIDICDLISDGNSNVCTIVYNL